MSQTTPTIDDILRELELDAPKTSGDPAVEALVQGLIEERQQPGIDPKSGEELPTRVFLHSARKKRTAEPSAAAEPSATTPEQDSELDQLLKELLGSDAAAAPAEETVIAPEPAPVQPAPALVQPDPALADEPMAEAKPEKPAAKVPEAEPAAEVPKAEAPAQEADPDDPYTYTTGPIAIDIDAIRSGAPAPKPIPAQKLDEIEDDPEEEDEQPVQQPVPSKPRRRAADPEKLRYAPCFRKIVSEEDAAQPGGTENIFRRIGASARTRGWILLLIFALSLVMMFLTEQSRHAHPDWYPSHLLMVLVSLLGICAGAAAWPTVSGGLLSLVKLEENRDTLPALGWLITMVQTVTLTVWPKGFTHAHVHCYLPVGILLLAVSCLGRILVADAGLRSLRFLHSENEKYIPHMVEDKRLATELLRGLKVDGAMPVSNRRAAVVTDLAASSLASDSSDRLSRLLTLAGLIAGAVAAVTGFLVTGQKHFAVTLFSAVFLFCASVLTAVLTAYPVARTARQMEPLRGIVSGEAGCEQYQKAGAVLVESRQLIPPDFISLAAIKTFEGTRLDDILVDAASILHGTDSVLTELFARIVGQRKALLREVDNVEVEETYGVSGWVGGKRILIGNRAMMASYDIRIPRKEYERRYAAKGHDLVYLAAAGELAAIFVLTVHPPIQAAEAAQSLTDNGIGMIVTTVDSFVTAERLSALFSIDPAMVRVLPRRLLPYAERLSSEVRIKQAILVNDGSISGLAGSLTCARRLRTMITLNRVLAVTSIILGCILTLIFSLLGAMTYLNPILFCGYAAVWLILSWILQKIFR